MTWQADIALQGFQAVGKVGGEPRILSGTRAAGLRCRCGVGADHRGSTPETLDASASLLFATDYDAFGRQFDVSGSERYRFVGLPWEASTGFTQMGLRFYDGDTGRFLSADPVLGQLSWPQTLNRYAYVANNPLRYTDPTGKAINLLAGLIGAGVGAAIGYGICVYSTGGWTSTQCGIAAGAGAVAGGLAGLTFGASLTLLGPGLGTAAAGGGFAFTGLSGLAAFTIAGATSGAVFGATEYLVTGGLTSATGGSWEFNARDLGESVMWGAIGGAAGGAAGYVLGAVGSRLFHGGLKSFGAKWAPANPRTGFPGGLSKAMGHHNQLGARVSAHTWQRGILGIARSPLSVVTSNPGGGFQAYGTVAGSPVRVAYGQRAGGIITAFVDSGGVPWYVWREAFGVVGSIGGGGWLG
jgi:RHS repeat-associated protein